MRQILVALVVVGLTAATPAEAKEFPDHKVKWDVKDEWTLEDPDAKAKEANFIAIAKHPRVPVQFYLLTRPTNDLQLKDLQAEATGVIRSMLGGQPEGVASGEGYLSGVKGFLVRGQGVLNGAPCYVLMWGIEKNNRHYVLLARAFHGAHEKSWRDIDKVRLGVRLTEGAGEPQPATEAFENLSGNTKGGEFEWPEKGPKFEGGVVMMPSHNLKWAIPAETPFQPNLAVNDESSINSPIVGFAGSKQAGENTSTCEIMLIIEERQPGFTPDALVHNSGFQSNFAKNFKERMPGGTTIDTDFEFAGTDGALFLMRGTDEEGYMSLGLWVGAHTQRVYLVRARFKGSRGCEKAWESEINKMLAGFEFIDPNEPVPGPIAGGALPDYGDRGRDADEEKEIKAARVSFEKPEGFARLTGLQGDLKFAIEGRSEDGLAYLYLDLQVIEMAALNQARKTFEDLAADRATAWKDQGGGSADTGKTKKAKFKGAKGIGWRFEGNLLGHPFVELGYIVRHKQDAYVIRAQFGGKDAEKKLKKEWKAIQKAWKFNK